MVHKKSVSKQGRKFAKGESLVQRDSLFDEIPKDTADHMETENAQDVGRIRDIVDEDKEIEENYVSTEDVLSTDNEAPEKKFIQLDSDEDDLARKMPRRVGMIDFLDEKLSKNKKKSNYTRRKSKSLRTQLALMFGQLKIFSYLGYAEDERLIKMNEKGVDSLSEVIKEETKEEVKEEDKGEDRKFQDEIPEGFDRVLWGDLMVMFNPDDEDKFWNSQQDWNIKKYPLKKEVLVQMLKLKLESKEDSTMALELIRFIKKLLAKHKNWLVHKQTACGKDFSNLFMVDNLPKIVGFSTHLASLVKSWLVQDQNTFCQIAKLTIPEQTGSLVKGCKDLFNKGLSSGISADKEIEENILSTEDVLSTDKEAVSTDKEKVSTDRPIDQFLKLSSDMSIVGNVKDSANAEINSLLDIPIQQDKPQIWSLPTLCVSISVIPEPLLRVAKLEKDVSELKKIDHSTKALDSLKSQFQHVIDNYLGSKLSDALQKVLQRQPADFAWEFSMKLAPESSKIQIPTINLEQKSKKSPSEICKIKKEQAEKQKMSKYTIKSTDKDHKRRHDDDEDPSAGPNQGKMIKRRRTKEPELDKKPSTTKETSKGKSSSKSSKTGKSVSTKEPVEELIAEVVMDDAVNTAGEDVVRDDDQPQDTSEPKTEKTLKHNWFKQPPRPPTPDLEWNKHQVVLDQPKQPWFNQMVSGTMDPLTFNDLIDTPIDFSKYVLNQLKIDNLT
ncbi:hypothetical protein Tco_1191000 [Tanacetum coccineum]